MLLRQYLLMGTLEEGARNIIRTMDMKRNEGVLIITDKETLHIANELKNAVNPHPLRAMDQRTHALERSYRWQTNLTSAEPGAIMLLVSAAAP